MTVREIIDMTAGKRVSDIHLTVGLPPMFRLAGKLTPMTGTPLADADIDAFARELCSKQYYEELERTGETDFAVTVGDRRLRINIYRQQGHKAIAARMLPLHIPTAQDLCLPDVIMEQTKKLRGLVLVTGPTGSGKSSTLAAMLEQVNCTSQRHIITLEQPIEYVYQPKKCIINQREVGRDTESFASGLRAALRQDPDVILVGEMRDLETISTAVTAAETGHLVFGTLHTKGAANTVHRIIDVFPEGQQGQIRMQLADVLECVVAQRLLPKIGGGRRAAFEVLLGTSAVRNLIRQEKTHQLVSTMQTSRGQGMILFDDDLARLVRERIISREDAMAAAVNREALAMQLGR